MTREELEHTLAELEFHNTRWAVTQEAMHSDAVIAHKRDILAHDAEQRAEIERLNSLIEKSMLIEVEATRVDSDGRGKPIIVPSGTMLVHKDDMARAEEKTNLLRKMAIMARDNYRLRAVEAAAKVFLAEPDISKFEAANRNYDKEFAEQVPAYGVDSRRITKIFDNLKSALEADNGKG